MFLVDVGKYEEAKVLYLASLEWRKRVLGAEHKDTLLLLDDLGYLYCFVLNDLRRGAKLLL